MIFGLVRFPEVFEVLELLQQRETEAVKAEANILAPR